MRRIDELFTAWPNLGSLRMTAMLRADGQGLNRKRVGRLMRKMGIAALGLKSRTSKPAPGHKIFPYLLRDLAIARPNQVWCADTTYIPIGRTAACCCSPRTPNDLRAPSHSSVSGAFTPHS